jgi:hypothetical protein
MTASDLVAVATIDTTLDVLTDFTADREAVKQALAHFTAVNGVAFETPAAETAATDEAGGATGGSAEYDVFNNDSAAARDQDARRRAGSRSSRRRRSSTSAAAWRAAAATTRWSCARRSAPPCARTSRSIQSTHAASRRSSRAATPRAPAAFGTGAFSGRSVRGQFDQLQASQETLQTLASDTGGKAFTDSNDFGSAFTQVIRDTSAYYLLGYSSTNDAKDGPIPAHHRQGEAGRPPGRAPQRLLRRAGLRAHRPAGSRTRPAGAAGLAGLVHRHPGVRVGGLVPSGRRPLLRAALRRHSRRRRASTTAGELDVLGAVRDEQGRPVGRIRQTLKLTPEGGTKQVLYQSGLALPPAASRPKVVVRDNANGAVGSFETGVFVPDLRRAPVKVSSVTLSTQLRPVEGRQRSESPLVREGVEILPSLTHVVDRAQKMYFYYEVYEPESAAGGTSSLKTSLAFYRGSVKVFETPLVERAGLDAADRGAAIFSSKSPPPASSPASTPARSTSSTTSPGRFAFPRLALYVR